MPQTPPPAANATPQPAVAGTTTPAGAGEAVPRPQKPARHRSRARRPLPDAMAVRRLEVPDSAPPYDDELKVTTRPGHVPPGAAPDRLPRPRSAAAAGPAETDDEAGAAARDRDQAAAGWPGQFAQVLAETLAGSRPPRQITPWTTEQARRHIRQLGPMLAARQQPQVRRVVTSSPAADVVEMTAVVIFGQTVRALAVRLERNGAQDASPGRDATPARWLCTAVEAA